MRHVIAIWTLKEATLTWYGTLGLGKEKATATTSSILDLERPSAVYSYLQPVIGISHAMPPGL